MDAGQLYVNLQHNIYGLARKLFEAKKCVHDGLPVRDIDALSYSKNVERLVEELNIEIGPKVFTIKEEGIKRDITIKGIGKISIPNYDDRVAYVSDKISSNSSVSKEEIESAENYLSTILYKSKELKLNEKLL